MSIHVYKILLKKMKSVFANPQQMCLSMMSKAFISVLLTHVLMSFHVWKCIVNDEFIHALYCVYSVTKGTLWEDIVVLVIDEFHVGGVCFPLAPWPVHGNYGSL